MRSAWIVPLILLAACRPEPELSEEAELASKIAAGLAAEIVTRMETGAEVEVEVEPRDDLRWTESGWSIITIAHGDTAYWGKRSSSEFGAWTISPGVEADWPRDTTSVASLRYGCDETHEYLDLSLGYNFKEINTDSQPADFAEESISYESDPVTGEEKAVSVEFEVQAGRKSVTVEGVLLHKRSIGLPVEVRPLFEADTTILRFQWRTGGPVIFRFTGGSEAIPVIAKHCGL